MFVSVFVIFLISFVVWYQIKFRDRNALIAKLPTPRSYPLIGNIPTIFCVTPKTFFNLLERLSLDLGPIFVITTHPFFEGTIISRGVKITEAILSSQKLLDKSAEYNVLKNWLGTGLLMSTGKKWSQRRKILTPSFHFQILEKFVEIMNEQGEVLVEKLEKLDGQEVDVFPLVNLYALDVICGE
jgi:cytochrome P450 family 4